MFLFLIIELRTHINRFFTEVMLLEIFDKLKKKNLKLYKKRLRFCSIACAGEYPECYEINLFRHSTVSSPIKLVYNIQPINEWLYQVGLAQLYLVTATKAFLKWKIMQRPLSTNTRAA